MRDYLYSSYLGLYVTVDFDGALVRRLEMTAAKPRLQPRGSPVIRSLEAYFRDGVGEFAEYSYDLGGMTPFRRTVLESLREIPAGMTRTYGAVAAAAGKPGAARAVGNAMASNPVPIMLPCHRVVAAGGLGGYTGGLDIKAKLLRLEGAIRA